MHIRERQNYYKKKPCIKIKVFHFHSKYLNQPCIMNHLCLDMLFLLKMKFIFKESYPQCEVPWGNGKPVAVTPPLLSAEGEDGHKAHQSSGTKGSR